MDLEKIAFLRPNALSHWTKLTSETIRVGAWKKPYPVVVFLDWFGGNILKEQSNRSLLVDTWAGLKAFISNWALERVVELGEINPIVPPSFFWENAKNETENV